jgi:hypothetical protein
MVVLCFFAPDNTIVFMSHAPKQMNPTVFFALNSNMLDIFRQVKILSDAR